MGNLEVKLKPLLPLLNHPIVIAVNIHANTLSFDIILAIFAQENIIKHNNILYP